MNKRGQENMGNLYSSDWHLASENPNWCPRIPVLGFADVVLHRLFKLVFSPKTAKHCKLNCPAAITLKLWFGGGGNRATASAFSNECNDVTPRFKGQFVRH